MSHESTKIAGTWGHMAASSNSTVSNMERTSRVPEGMAAHPAHGPVFRRSDRRARLLFKPGRLPGRFPRSMVQGHRLAAGKEVHLDNQDPARRTDQGRKLCPVSDVERRETNKLTDGATIGHMAAGYRRETIRTQPCRPGTATHQPWSGESHHGAHQLPGSHRVSLCIDRTPRGDLWDMAGRTETQDITRARPRQIRAHRPQRRNRL